MSDNPWQKYREDFYRYDLILYAEVPETSGIDIAHLSSPIVTLGRHEGHCSDADAPEWTHVTAGISFEIRQPCSSMAAVFTEIAFWPENAGTVRHFIISESIYQVYWERYLATLVQDYANLGGSSFGECSINLKAGINLIECNW